MAHIWFHVTHLPCSRVSGRVKCPIVLPLGLGVFQHVVRFLQLLEVLLRVWICLIRIWMELLRLGQVCTFNLFCFTGYQVCVYYFAK